MIEILNLLHRDLMETNILFDGKVVVFSGDFKQTMFVVCGGKRENFLYASFLCSKIQNELEKQLSENMQAKIDPTFCQYLMRIGYRK